MTRRLPEALRRPAALAAFAAVCYLPLLGTSPGRVVADTKSYLYLDPARLLSRAWSMWDPHVGLGTVTHQNIGFLWPMGPYYWLLEQLGIPDWVAQRLWWGSIMFVAGLGVRYLLRTWGWRGPAVGAAMCAYGLSPYLLTISVRISAILLPFVALPWLVALIVRAARTHSWRHPAAFALVVATAGTSNATSILLVGVGVAVWLAWALLAQPVPRRAVLAATTRTAGLTLLTNAWWIAGLSVQASHGVPVLDYTESVEVTAAASAAQEVLRGLGYWFFYGDDALGPWVGPSRAYQTDAWLVAVTFGVPFLALLGGALVRWRHRPFAVAILVVGVALAVGVYPYRDPSPLGAALKVFLHSDVGMAMRSLPRAVPLVVLALALMLAAALRALADRWPSTSVPAAGAVILLVLASLPPLWRGELAPENLGRPEQIPEHWVEAGRVLDERDDGTRVLEVPGSDFTSYRWGTTVDPVTPGLTDRPMVARELVPQGGAAGWNLLKAFDGRLQANTAEPATVAPVARILRAGDVLVRADLRYEHYDTPRPRSLWQLLTSAGGLGEAIAIGPTTPNRAVPPAPMIDELELSTDVGLADPPAVAVLPVEGAPAIVAVKPAARPVVLAGDGEGVVDAAAAGLVDGTELLWYSAAVTAADLVELADAGAGLVVTDSNRRRAERWGSIRFTNGYTEPEGLEPLRVDHSDARLPVFPEADDDARTVAVHRGGITANATSYGGRNEYLPEDRPAMAVDGDLRTAWRAARDDPTVGERLRITLDEPASPGTVTFVAPTTRVNRWVSRVRLTFDGRDAIEVDLDARSHSAPGQVVDVGDRRFRQLDIEVLADTVGPRSRYGGLTSVGFAEVVLGDGRLQLDEAIRTPVDLLRRLPDGGLQQPLAVVLSRLRSAPTDIERLDEERRMVRLVELPVAREVAVSGTVRLSVRADDPVLDALLGATGPVARASSRLPSLGARARAGADGDPSTAWVAALGPQEGQWLEVGAAAPLEVSRLDVTLLTDGRHSVPTRVGVEVDGARIATMALPELPDGPPGTTTTVPLELPSPQRGATLRLVVDEVRPVETVDWAARSIRTLPVGVAELGIPALQVGAPSDRVATGCRDDLLQLDGRPLPVEIAGSVDAARSGGPLELRACAGAPVALPAGTRELRAADGGDTGLDIDRLVLRSAAGGAAWEGPTLLLPPAAGDRPEPAPEVTVVDRGQTSVRARVSGLEPGAPVWLSFGQSLSSGWSAAVDGEPLGSPRLVDGFANGWRFTPRSASVEIDLSFTPQRRVTIALWVSLVGAIGCVALVVRRPRRPFVVPAPEPVWLRPADPGPPLSPAATALVVAVAAAAAWALAGPLVAAGAAAVAVGSARLRPGRLLGLVAPLAVGACAAYLVQAVWRRRPLPGLEWVTELPRAHPLAWLAVVALVVDAAVATVRERRR